MPLGEESPPLVSWTLMSTAGGSEEETNAHKGEIEGNKSPSQGAVPPTHGHSPFPVDASSLAPFSALPSSVSWEHRPSSQTAGV